MTNNDVFREIRFAFNFSNDQLIAVFGSAEYSVTKKQIDHWLKKEDEDQYLVLKDVELSTFLNGLINEKRGKKEGPAAVPEKSINNNIIFRKIKIALNLKDEDILEILLLVNFRISKHELSAFFRNPNKSQYRACHDQILRNFLRGMKMKYRDSSTL